MKTIQAVTNSQEKHIYYKFGDEYILYEKDVLLNYLKKGTDDWLWSNVEKQKALEELDRDTSKLDSW